MSTVYSLDPVTSGKVVAHTSLGVLEIELFCNEAPMATRNFLGLCLERYYDGVTFHRLVKGETRGGGCSSRGASLGRLPWCPWERSCWGMVDGGGGRQ